MAVVGFGEVFAVMGACLRAEKRRNVFLVADTSIVAMRGIE